jgi:hypothetical protein
MLKLTQTARMRMTPRLPACAPLSRWVDLDATLHSSAYSVGHVLMGTSGMDDGAGHSDEMIMVSMIGNLEMQVESVS